MKNYMLLCLSLLWTAWSTGAQAQPDLQFSGFGSVGAVHNGSDLLGFHRDYTMEASDDDWSFNADSMLGLQLNANISERFDALVQVVLKDRVSKDLEDSLEWAFVRYRPNDEWAIRAGRLGLDLYMLSEYKDVSYAYLWVRPVPEFYSLISSISRFDGVDFSYRTQLQDYMFEAKLAYGTNQSELAGADQNINIKLEQVAALTLSLTSSEWLWRLSYAQADTTGVSDPSELLISALESVPSQFWPGAGNVAQTMRYVNRTAEYYAAGVQFDDGEWTVQSELGYTDTHWELLQPYWAGYLSVGKHFDQFTLYGVYGWVANTRDIPLPESPAILPSMPPELQGALVQLFDAACYTFGATRFDQQTLSLGVRWDFAEDLALKVQWDLAEIKDDGNALWVREQPFARDAHVQLFSINLSFTF